MLSDRKLWGLLLGWLLLLAQPSLAQDSPAPRLLTSSLDPQTGGVSLVWVDLAEGSARPVTNFNSPSRCLPAAAPSAQWVLYEPLASSQVVYQVDLENGVVRPLDAAQKIGLTCPLVNPRQPSIAWIQPFPESVAVVITDLEGANGAVLASYTDASELLWSPDGQILIYSALAQGIEARLGMAHAEQQIAFWTGDLGLLVDYLWLPDSSALIVAYYSAQALEIGRLERSCLLMPTACQPTPLASFDLNASVLLMSAFDPAQTSMVIAVEASNERGDLESDLYRLALTGAEEPMRLTESPSLTKTGVYWGADGWIYYIGSRLDPLTFSLSESAIYRIPATGGPSEVAYRAEGYQPLQIIWASD